MWTYILVQLSTSYCCCHHPVHSQKKQESSHAAALFDTHVNVKPTAGAILVDNCIFKVIVDQILWQCSPASAALHRSFIPSTGFSCVRSLRPFKINTIHVQCCLPFIELFYNIYSMIQTLVQSSLFLAWILPVLSFVIDSPGWVRVDKLYSPPRRGGGQNFSERALQEGEKF